MNRRESIWRVIHGERSKRLPRALFGGGRWSYRQAGLEMRDLDKDPDILQTPSPACSMSLIRTSCSPVRA